MTKVLVTNDGHRQFGSDCLRMRKKKKKKKKKKERKVTKMEKRNQFVKNTTFP